MIDESDDDVILMVIEDLRERRRVGFERYRSVLGPFNGKDALWEAYEECLDMANYLRQAIEERRRERRGEGCTDGAGDNAGDGVAAAADQRD